VKQRIGDILVGGLILTLLAAPPARLRSAEAAPLENPREPEAQAREIRPLLARYCYSCHGEKKPKAGLNLEALRDDQDPGKWKLVWDRLKSRQMPPSDRPQPTAEERERVTVRIEEILARHTLDGHPDPGPLRPRRLNAREYRNTLRDLAVRKGQPLPRRATYANRPDGSVNLYDAIIPPPEHPCAFVARILPPDTSDGGFDTIGENLSIPPYLLDRYLRSSKRLLDDTFTLNLKRGPNDQWPLFQDLMKLRDGPPPKGLTRRQAVSAYLREFAGRAFRRPVTAEEAEKYAKLFDRCQEDGEDFETSIRVSLQAILISPRCVVLWSEPPGNDAVPVRPLDDYELASRLSYFLWSAPPDRELFQAEQQGRLRNPEVLEQQTRRMLNDRRITDGLLEGFVQQWLQLDRLERNAPDADRYPLYFRNNLGEVMRQELLLFTDAILVEDRSILEFIDADWGFVCYPLAQHYGIDNFPGKKPPDNVPPPWYRLKFADRRRGGVLTMGKVLTGTSQPVRTSPVHRGKWLLETILGTPPPPPPPDVDNQLKEEPEEGKKNRTVPQRLAQHRANAACASCHNLIDPLGLAFENFDPTGKWRDRDQDQPIDAKGVLVDGKTFDGVVELKALLRSRKDDFVRCYTEKMLSYALGRKLEFYDAATVKQIVAAVVRDDYKFSRVVVEVVKSYPFRHRRVKEVAD
jgi:hypothetical protein